MMQNRKLPPEFLLGAAEMIRILGNGQRLQILEYLDLHGESKVNDIVSALAAPQGAISQHLNKMRLAGVLSCRRDRREVYYRIAEARAITILNCLRKKFAETENHGE